MLCEITDVADPNLCPRRLWTPVFPRRILSALPGKCKADLLGPEVSLLLLCLSLWHPLLYRQRSLILKDHSARERNGSCHFSSFKWAFAALSVTEPPRGRHQTKEKTFHILLSFTTESSYLFSHSVYLFLWTSHIIFPFIIPLVSVACFFCVL